jgi:hypothetical protein
MKRKRKRKIETPEEREARKIRSEAMDRMMRDRWARSEAEMRAKDPGYRGLDYWIDQVKAEREAGGAGTRKRFLTPEEREEREIRSEALDRMLKDRLGRIEAEMTAKDPNYRGLGYWIAQVRAEREAENAA